MKEKHSLIAVCTAIVLFTLNVNRSVAGEIDFEKLIQPILEERCWDCHGPDEQESGLRLDMRPKMLQGGDSGIAAVVPSKPDKSYLIDLINHKDEEMAMPPDGDRLSAKEIKLLTQWIKEGAVWPGQMAEVAEEKIEHWSFLPRQKKFDHNNIGDFLKEKLSEKGLEISQPADPRALIRRASIVLTGIAPTPERTSKFVESFETDQNAAYENLIEELLGSKHFGERWAQHWLDVIRWAETNGSESNLYRKNAWLYRDYVVRSFNEDKPYDRFVMEQLAGDILGNGDATGFLVAGPHVPAATVGQEPTAIRQARADRMDEILQTVGASVMGVTIGCARCHNHKFDPISIQDYYSMSAAFQDVEFGSRYPEFSQTHPRSIREKQLRTKLETLRQEMRSNGWAWSEDWTGYQEVHFPRKKLDELKISFNGRWVQADELEVLGKSIGQKTESNSQLARSAENLLEPDFGVKISENEVTQVTGWPLGRLNDGQFSTKGWRSISPKGSKERPWLEFNFPKEVTIEAVRISSNREDFYETDYLVNLHKRMYGEFKIELKDQEDQWKPFCSTVAMKNKSKQNKKMSALQTQIQEVIGELLIEGPQPSFLGRFVDPVDTFVLARGSPESPRDQVDAAAPKMLKGQLNLAANSPGPQRRKAFGQWVINPENPLTARVMANRIWHHIFGSGIVATPSDFGLAGAPPTHPELLDWLAQELIDSKWSMKQMIRKIVLSKAFRQSSLSKQDGLKLDASAALLWRFPPRRIEAESIRDSILQASGALDRTIGGPSYRIHNVKKRYAQWEVLDNHGEKTWRRMLYQERMRRVDDRIFTAFDFPDCGQIRAKRPVSTTPLQALNLMNSDFIVSQSKRIAERAKKESSSETQQVKRCFELLLCRQPSEEELDASLSFAKTFSFELLCRTLINTNEFAFLP